MANKSRLWFHSGSNRIKGMGCRTMAEILPIQCTKVSFSLFAIVRSSTKNRLRDSEKRKISAQNNRQIKKKLRKPSNSPPAIWKYNGNNNQYSQIQCRSLWNRYLEAYLLLSFLEPFECTFKSSLYFGYICELLLGNADWVSAFPTNITLD